MKKVFLSVVGGSLFIAGYFHVHHQAAFIDSKNAQASFITPATSKSPASLFPIKSLPAFAFRFN